MSDLAILNSASKRLAVATHIDSLNTTGKNWWIAGDAKSGQWRWINGQTIAEGWSSGEPESNSGNNCVYLNNPTISTGAPLYDYNCDSNYGFICQKK